MAKKRKYPKRPKQGASLAVWQRYEQRVKEVDSYNRQIDADAKKKDAIQKKTRSHISGTR